MKTTVFASLIGGSGKTIGAWELGCKLHKEGYKVLLIDLDVQGMLGYLAGINAEELTGSVYNVLQGTREIKSVVHSIEFGLDIVVNSMDLYQADVKFTQSGKEYLLKKQLEKVQTMYDYCIIDTAPYRDVLLINALTASDSVIIPIQDDEYTLNMIEHLKEIIDDVIKDTNPGLVVEWRDTKL